jgi:hypothetical protein
MSSTLKRIINLPLIYQVIFRMHLKAGTTAASFAANALSA